jgi:SAM-dependent methyltransferase
VFHDRGPVWYSEPMKLKQPLPPGRSYEQIRNHYEVERAIADRLRGSSREERRAIYGGMYDELFAKVPDHPRLTRRSSPEMTRKANRTKERLLGKMVGPDTVVLEFGPGDCQFAKAIARRAGYVYGVDISDQTGTDAERPDNFELIVYDGFELSLSDDTVDVAFSDQLIEHFHPEDTVEHFKLVRRILKPGGVYIFRTPHKFRGPADVSRYFSDEPRGFHLKEWSFGEVGRALHQAGFSSWRGYWSVKGYRIRFPHVYSAALERLLPALPRRVGRGLSRYLLPTLLVAGVK